MSNFGEHGAREIKAHEELFNREDLGSPENKSLRRMEKYFICNRCDKDYNEETRMEGYEKSSVTLAEISSEDEIFFFPVSVFEDIGYEETIEEMSITLMFPTTSDAINILEDVNGVRSKTDVVRKLFETRNLTRNDIYSCYENEINKYKQNKNSSDRFVGVIKDFTSKVLSSVQKVDEDFRISGSAGWWNRQFIEMKFRHAQMGMFFLILKLSSLQHLNG